MVVEQRLSDVDDLVAGHADVGQSVEHGVEVLKTRFVGAGVIGGDDHVELDTEPPIAARERCPVDVRHDDESVALLQSSQRQGGVGECGPRPNTRTELLTLGGRDRVAELAGHPAQTLGKHVGVRRRRHLGFNVMFVGAEEREQLLFGTIDSLPRAPRLERIDDPALPVDQRSIAVEAQRPTAGKCALELGVHDDLREEPVDVAG